MGPEVNTFAMRRGLTLGTMFTLYFIASTIPAIAFISWGIVVLILWYAYKSGVKCREEIRGGEMSYGGGLWFTIQLFLYSSMVAGVMKYVYLKWIDTNYLTEYGAAMKEMMEQMKMATAETTGMINDMMTPENMVLYSVMGDVMLGVLVGLVMGFMLKRNKD